MNRYDLKAADLQTRGQASEAGHTVVYDDNEIKRAIKYTREDVIMLVSYLSSANSQLRTIKWLVFLAVIALGAITYKIYV
ncbi:MAG: hypothetical protein V4691_03500 [Pseudomonadota bacterium]